MLAFTINIAPVKVYDALDYKLYDWPGHGVDEDSGYQYNEAEYMTADEYDKLIADPSNYWQRFYLPRVIGAMEPWTTLDPFTDLVEGPMVGPFFIPFGTPPVQDMLKKMMEAGNAALEWIQAMTKMDGDSMAKFGIPGFAGGATKAPYDILGDTMRGTRGLMLDKFRQPGEGARGLRAARAAGHRLGRPRRATSTSTRSCSSRCTRAPTGSSATRTSARSTGRRSRRSCSASSRRASCRCASPRARYNDRLEAIHDPEIPAGKMIWMFDATNMSEAKKHLGGYQCIGGNVPGALLTTGTVQDMDDYVRQLMEDVAGDGGFILGSGIVIDAAKPECVKAMIDAGKKYGAQDRDARGDGPGHAGPERRRRRGTRKGPPPSFVVWPAARTPAAGAPPSYDSSDLTTPSPRAASTHQASAPSRSLTISSTAAPPRTMGRCGCQAADCLRTRSIVSRRAS